MQAELKEHEDEELESLYRRMCNGKRIVQSVTESYQYTGGDGESASEKLGRALRTLSEVSDADEQLAQLYSQLADVDNLLNDFNHELAEYQKNCEFSDEEFYETEKRLNEINHLKTKYGNSYEKIMDYCKKQEERIEILENYDAYMQELKASCEQLEQDYLKRAQKLSTLRKKKANMLEKKIQKGLEDLNFEQVQFEIHFAEKKEYSKEGIDDAEFRISLNQGQQVKPLTEVASGGELSRIMLAIKAVMADHLMFFSDQCHLFRHFLCRTSADTNINFIKDQCLNLIFICHYSFDRKRTSGDLYYTSCTDCSDGRSAFPD